MPLNNPSGAMGVKSVQQGLIDTFTTTTGTAPEDFFVDVTITSVTVAKSFVILYGGSGAGGTNAAALDNARRGYFATDNGMTPRGYLLNATTLRVYLDNAADAGAGKAFSIRWQVVENW